MVKRIVVGAHYGLRDWIGQRASAVYMAIYTVIFAIAALTLPEMSYEAWSGLFSGGLMRFLTFLFFLALFYHAWIGVRDIFMDYIKPTGLRLALHVVVLFLLFGYAGWAAQILWRL
ncbi:MAG TPA: succinate dehydrogenase, hydrophobic membrane anchor protein [Azoarcus taiwanensis]|uniref:Succinate dehydrogenase hydrophobic membrane anchor subunit n=1 Tax=Azoarcus taiwanensis TaxID=666964 RepID=A0A972F9E2_9RHOO|nr:succinate dehydrogenase, hydrophobic membrane anchor protein [Azoarcus taiwanensis]NMG04708.1 succinate dehydrogenase, hydrophobic membrane anchor protein [Azoarcus taiwanensis]HRQ59098.1 succinate dehydrogenase, hydrophobic membrane anchor protein [Azoarcus taiwanensis]